MRGPSLALRREAPRALELSLFSMEPLPEFVTDIMSQGTEDAQELEAAVRALQASPLVKSVEMLGANKGMYATLWCLHPRLDPPRRGLVLGRGGGAADGCAALRHERP